MDLKDIQTRKIRSVHIDYAYEGSALVSAESPEGEWEYIRIQFDNGNTVDISRLQIEAFLRINKVAKDLQTIQTLRDDLVRIFGKDTPIAPHKPPV